MKLLLRIGLVMCFYVFSASALITHSQAEEYYTYKDPQGNLVISNKPPPPGSSVLKKQDLPEIVGQQITQPPPGTDPQPNGRPESRPQPQKSK